MVPISEEETDELGIAEVKTDNEDVYVTFKDTDEEFAMGIARLQALQKHSIIMLSTKEYDAIKEASLQRVERGF